MLCIGRIYTGRQGVPPSICIAILYKSDVISMSYISRDASESVDSLQISGIE